MLDWFNNVNFQSLKIIKAYKIVYNIVLLYIVYCTRILYKLNLILCGITFVFVYKDVRKFVQTERGKLHDQFIIYFLFSYRQPIALR